MNRYSQLLFLIAFLLPVCLEAQEKEEFSYISDRRFIAPNHLIGFDFRPQVMEIRGESEKELSPGEYSFGITSNNLYVNGSGIKGVYSVNNINPTDYGYKLVLMNARDPRIQGHLKVMLNKRAHVEALVFKRSNNDPEMIFYQAFMPEKRFNQEKAYFTDRNEVTMLEGDTLWGTKLMPFMRIHMDKGHVQERLQMSDSTSIEFVERITIIEKKKRGRKKKKKKKKNDSEEETKEEEITTTKIEAEGVTEADPGAMPPIEAAESVEEVAEEELKKKEKVKVKIVKEYFVKVRTILSYEDGTSEDKTIEVPLKNKISFFENQNGGNDPTIPPFELEVDAKKKGDPVVIYLTKRQTISGILIDGKKYLMRGQ